MNCQVCNSNSFLFMTPVGEVCSTCRSYLVKQGILEFELSEAKQQKTFNNSVRKKLWKINQNCKLCNKAIKDFNHASIDHIIPISKGGPKRDMRNLQLAHKLCNNRKGNRVYFKDYYLFIVFYRSYLRIFFNSLYKIRWKSKG